MTNDPIDPSNEFDRVASEIGSYWDARRRRMVEGLWAEGRSFGFIAKHLGTTRSTIAGYIRRRGLHRHGREISPDIRPRRHRRAKRAPMLALPAPPELLALPAPEPTVICLPGPPTIWNSIFGRETESQWIARLERTRLHQERVWFVHGRSREWIIKEFAGWPMKYGYPPYEWAVGQPR